MKTCRTCGEAKPLHEFYFRRDRGKYQTECKVCLNKRASRWKAENRERARKHQRDAKRRAWKTNPRPLLERNERWRKQNAEKKRAHNLVDKALRRGDLVKPRACEACGQERRLHGHHDDYSAPLVVRWLCSPCHAAVHMDVEVAA